MGLVGRPLGLGGAHRGVGNRSRGDLSRIHILYSGIKSLVRKLVFVALRRSAATVSHSAAATVMLQCVCYSASVRVLQCRYSATVRMLQCVCYSACAL